jgi:hypothetical protein
MQDSEQENLAMESASSTEAKPAPKKKRVVKKRVVKPKPLPKPEPVETIAAAADKPKPKRIVFSPDRERVSHAKGTRFLPMIAVLVFVVAIGLFALNQKQSATDVAEQTAADLRVQVEGEVAGLKERLQLISEELQQQKEAKQEPKYNEYTNNELGIRFHYPQSAGEAKQELIDENPEEPGDEYVSITFSSFPDLWLMAVPHGYTGGARFTYDGSQETLTSLCEKPLDVTEEGYCDVIGVASTQTVVQVRPILENDFLNVVKTVPLNLDSATFAGLTVNVRLGAPPVTGRDLFAPTAETKQQDALISFFRNLIKRTSLSIVVEENLNVHETVLSTMQFLTPEPLGS